MFVINSYLINKMGWTTYSTFRGLGLTVGENIAYTLFEDDNLVRFFIVDSDVKKCYVIKEKQNNKNSYNFIICDYEAEKPVFKKIKFTSNTELLKLIIDNNACNKTYQRHFSINKILK